MVRSRVYVGGLPWGTQERDLERFFRGYGRIMEVLLKNGYGFVEFDDARDAEDAAHELNGTKLMGERVTVERARGKPRGRDQWSTNRPHERFGPPVRTNYRLIVENLSSRVSWQDLKSYMRQAGEVTFADAHKQHRDEGIVEFASYSDLKNAIRKFDDTVLSGKRIRLVEDKKSSKRRRSGSNASRGRSRSRSSRRSRSRSRSSRSHSRRRSKSRSRSGSNHSERKAKFADPRIRSHSKPRDKSAERSRSARKSESKSKLRSRSRSRSHKSAERSRSRSADRDHAARSRKSPSRSRSKSRSNSRDRSRSPSRHSDKRSRSRSPSQGRSRSRSRSHSRD